MYVDPEKIWVLAAVSLCVKGGGDLDPKSFSNRINGAAEPTRSAQGLI